MLPQSVRLRDLSLQDILLANVKRNMGMQQQQRWQTPQENEQSSSKAALAQIPLFGEKKQNDQACDWKDGNANTAKGDQIGLVGVDGGENAEQSQQPKRNNSSGFHHQTERSSMQAQEAGGLFGPYQICRANSSPRTASARYLHGNPEFMKVFRSNKRLDGC
jgi:hypothetical protein